MLPNLEGAQAARAERRLDSETVIWLTTVRADGQPQTSPVGFLWDGTTFVIRSQPEVPKIRNLRGNPRISLHLDQNDGGEESVLTVEGVAVLNDPPMTDDEIAAYVERHMEAIRGAGLTPQEALDEFSEVIRVTPTRVRHY